MLSIKKLIYFKSNLDAVHICPGIFSVMYIKLHSVQCTHVLELLLKLTTDTGQNNKSTFFMILLGLKVIAGF